jgi:hypothetical protein
MSDSIRAELADGRVLEFPAGTSPDVVQATVKRMIAPPEKPVATRVGEAIMDIPRQVGLTARYGLEGLGQTADVITEPIRAGMNALGANIPQSTSQAVTSLLDRAGVPTPQGANERVIGDATRMVAGVAGLGGAGNALAKTGTGVTKKVLQSFGENQAQNLTGAAGAGLFGGAVREAGGNPMYQVGASVLGSLAAPAAVSGTQKLAATLRNYLPESVNARVPGFVGAQQIDEQISTMLKAQGVDWANVSERAKQSLRQDMEKALQTGQTVDPQAVRRLLDFKQVPGSVPTRGMLTLDPGQITKEQNLAKTAANMSDLGLQKLPNLQNQNNRALIEALNNAGAKGAPDAYQTGEQLIGALRQRVDASKSGIDSLYNQARDSHGRSFPLDGSAFTQKASKLLDDNLLGGALPPSVQQHLNKIATGEVPFTVDYAEQLKTAVGKLQRGTSDGQQRMALGMIRQALDDTPVMPLDRAGMAARPVNPGNLPSVSGSSQVGEDAIQAFNRARQANRAFMQRVESTPALKAVMDGVEPDKFIQKFVVGDTASFADVTALKRALASDKGSAEAVKSYLIDYFKRQALSGAADEVGKFSPSAFAKALEKVGDRKLGVFFEPAEIEQLKAVQRAGSYMVHQPVGSAVNNSNSGAMLAGVGLDTLDRIAGVLPLGLDKTVQGITRNLQLAQILRTSPALIAPQPAGQKSGSMAALAALLAAPRPPSDKNNEPNKRP